MTTQSDIKKLAEQMAGSMNSFDDIKAFQKQLMWSFIDTALEAEMEDHLGFEGSLPFIFSSKVFGIIASRFQNFRTTFDNCLHIFIVRRRVNGEING